jgi:adenosine deaminase
VRSAEDPTLLHRIVDAGVGLEVCPASNAALGVYPSIADVPLRTLVDAGARVALGADDPLLFGPRLAAQYETARQRHGFDDAGLADLARNSVLVSRAPAEVKARLLTGIQTWLAPDGQPPDGQPESQPGGQPDGQREQPMRTGSGTRMTP